MDNLDGREFDCSTFVYHSYLLLGSFRLVVAIGIVLKIYGYVFPSQVVEDLLTFISFHNLRHVALEKATENINKPLVYLKKRLDVSLPVAEHPVWIPPKYKPVDTNSSE